MYKIHLHKLGLELVETERAVAPAILLLSLALSGPEESEKKKKKQEKERGLSKGIQIPAGDRGMLTYTMVSSLKAMFMKSFKQHGIMLH